MADAPTSICDITDDLLELVLLRVDSHACLVRAAAVCKLWRRVIADASFLRRFRKLHPPAVAGYHINLLRSYHYASRSEPDTRPAFEPSSSTIDARHFSLDFLSVLATEFGLANIVDSRGSLLLMEFHGPKNAPHDFPGALVVCEPLTKRYTRIPRPRDFDANTCRYEQSYLVDGVTDEAGGLIGMSNFRVLCELYRGNVAHAAEFTAGGDKDSWRDKAIDHIFPRIDYQRRILGRAAGSCYFYNKGMLTGTALDGGTGEYSTFALPNTEDWDDRHASWSFNFCVTEGYDGKPRILSLLDNTLKVFAKIDGEWVLEKEAMLLASVRRLLGRDYEPFPGQRFRHKWGLSLHTKGSGFVILRLQVILPRFFFVDLDTLEVKIANEDMANMTMYRSELPWPPALHKCPTLTNTL